MPDGGAGAASPPLTIFTSCDEGRAWEPRTGGGRWNSEGHATIYGSTSFGLMMLERLVHLDGPPAGSGRWASATIGADLSVEAVAAHSIPGWEDDDHRASCRFGDRWLEERRSLVLLVPSVVVYRSVAAALPLIGERNLLINPAHPDFGRIAVDDERPLSFDRRLVDG